MLLRRDHSKLETEDPDKMFSLIVSTIGQTPQLPRLLDSLKTQKYRDFEVIIIDQSLDESVKKLLERYDQELNIVYTSSERGVSRGRNRGLELAQGAFLAFPDDDCWYSEDLLERISALLSDPDADAMTGRCLDDRGRSAAGRHAKTARAVTKWNVWKCGVSAAMFFKRHVFADIGQFDPSVGVGSGTLFQSGEETDVMLRALARGHSIRYDPTIIVFHDLASRELYSREVVKAWLYGLGMGFILRRHRFGLPFLGYAVVRPAVGAVFSLCMGQFRLSGIRLVRAAARLEGWRRGRRVELGLLEDAPTATVSSPVRLGRNAQRRSAAK